MPMEYFIEEMTKDGKVPHGSTFNGLEAGKIAADIQLKRGNPVTVTPIYISSNQIDDDSDDYFQYPLTAEELFKQSHGDDADYDSQLSEIKRIYEACTVAGNNMIARLMRFTNNSEGMES